MASGTWIGADTQQLHQLGTTLNNQIDAISHVVSTVESALNSTVWQGPAHDRFVDDRTGSFKHALNQLNEAFGAAGRDCIARSEDLARVMGIR